MLSRHLVLLGLLCSHASWCAVAQDLEVTNPVSGDVFEAGGDVTVEWISSLDSSHFDISLLSDGKQVGEPFCESGGCLAPNGFLVVALPRWLAAGDQYSFLVGDRIGSVSLYGESENFEVVASAEAGVSSDTDGGTGGTVAVSAGDDGDDGDNRFMWGIIIGSAAAVAVLLLLCVIVRKGCPCCCRDDKRDNSKAHNVQQGGFGDDFDLGMDVDRDPFCSSGGASDGGVSLAGLVEMGGLSPVQEETAEVVTKNPMIKAIANGAQFHSGGGDSSKFHSVGNSSKFQSVGGDSAKFHSVGESSKFHSVGDSSKFQSSADGGVGEDEEEGGGMFADADVVAALAAAAAREAEQNDQVRITSAGTSGSRWGWQQGSDGGWVKSPSVVGEESSSGVVDTAKSTFSAKGLGPTSAEEKAADAAGADADPAAGGRPAPAADWMVSTRRSFNAKTGSIAASWLGALEASKAKGRAGAREKDDEEEKETIIAGSPATVKAGVPGVYAARVPSMEERAEELVNGGGPAAAVEGGGGENAAGQGGAPVAPAHAPAPSPEVVDGISRQAFRQAEAVARALPAVAKGRVASEPECEVPKPGSLGADIGRRALGEYAWLSSSRRDLREAKTDEVTTVAGGDASPQVALDTGSKDRSTDLSVAGSGVPPPGLSKLKPTASIKLRAPAGPLSASVLPTESAVDRETGTAASTVDENEQKPGAGSEQHEAALHLPPKPQGTPRRTLLTPRTAAGGSRGFSSAPDLSLDHADASSSVTPSNAARTLLATPDRISRVSEVVQAFENMTPKRARSAVWTPGAYTPTATTPGAGHWSTPLATPDRTPKKVKSAPEELSVVSARGNGAGRVWTTPVATPDRSPAPTAPDSGTGGATPERTVSPAHESRGNVGVSPADEGPQPWQLESPAGVDGFPSPTGSDVRTIAFKQTGGRMIPSILGAVDAAAAAAAVTAAQGTPVVTPCTTDNSKALLHRMNSSGDSSSGAGWEAEARISAEPSFRASQVAAFVADAQAEAAADAKVAEAARTELAEKAEAKSAKETGAETAEETGAEPTEAAGAEVVEEAGAESVEEAETKSAAVIRATTEVCAEDEGVVLSAAAVLAWSQTEAYVDRDMDTDADADGGGFDGAVAWPARQLPPEIAAAQSEESDSEEDGELTTTNVPEAAGTEEVVVVPGVVRDAQGGVVDDNEVEVDSLADMDGLSPKASVEEGEEEEEENAAKVVEEDRVVQGGERAEDTETRRAVEGGENEKIEVVGEKLVLVDAGKEQEQSPVEEAAEVAALVAEAMALADKDGNVVEALYRVAGDEDVSDTDLPEVAGGSAGSALAAMNSNPRKTVGELAMAGSFGSSKSILTWAEGDGTEEGDAERDAQEVQALVAEALALVKEASEDAKVGDVVGY